jgi:hypothetical protein
MDGLTKSAALMLEAVGRPVTPAPEVIDLSPEEIRIFEVYKLMLQGMRRPHSVWQWSKVQGWGVSIATIADYMKKAERDAQKFRPRNLSMERTRIVNQLALLYERCVERNDDRGALAMLAETSKLLGLYPKDGTGKGIPNPVIVFQREVVQGRTLDQAKQIFDGKEPPQLPDNSPQI